MSRLELRVAGGVLLGQARALRAVVPDAEAMRALPVADQPAAPQGDAQAAAVRVALGYLRSEMLLVRSGEADGLHVLDDEVAHVEGLLRDL